MTKKLREYLERNKLEKFDLKAVLFDMDGVLYDSMPYHASTWQETMEHYGFKQTKPEDFYLHEGRVATSTIEMMIRDERGSTPSKEEVDKIYAHKSKLFGERYNNELLDGAKEVVDYVAGNNLTPVLVTGSAQLTLLDRLNEHFTDIFKPETMVTALDVKIGKPHPEPFLMGLQKGGNLEPHQAIVVENAPLGTEAAHKAGIFTIVVNTGPLDDQILWDSGADMVLKSMIDLYELLPNLFQEIETLEV